MGKEEVRRPEANQKIVYLAAELTNFVLAVMARNQSWACCNRVWLACSRGHAVIGYGSHAVVGMLKSGMARMQSWACCNRVWLAISRGHVEISHGSHHHMRIQAPRWSERHFDKHGGSCYRSVRPPDLDHKLDSLAVFLSSCHPSRVHASHVGIRTPTNAGTLRLPLGRH
jgi:hypothetical protein